MPNQREVKDKKNKKDLAGGTEVKAEDGADMT